MAETRNQARIEFSPFTLCDKSLYEVYLEREEERGCEYSFANLYLWGRQGFAVLEDHVVMFSQFDRRSVYPYPIGRGEKRAVLDRIIADARERGIPCRITGLSEKDKATVEALYPDRFRFHSDEAAYDYVYAIDDLADLEGKKYHAKRNHLNRFFEACPHYTVEPLTEENRDGACAMAEDWYSRRISENPNADYHMEKAAIARALRDLTALKLEGVLLKNGEEILGFSLASRLSADTFDVHFEKARADVQGAYAAVNAALAKHIRSKFPKVKYLNREEDMGIEGLRRAKQSYYPHHMVKKYWACLLEEGYEY